MKNLLSPIGVYKAVLEKLEDGYQASIGEAKNLLRVAILVSESNEPLTCPSCKAITDEGQLCAQCQASKCEAQEER